MTLPIVPFALDAWLDVTVRIDRPAAGNTAAITEDGQALLEPQLVADDVPANVQGKGAMVEVTGGGQRVVGRLTVFLGTSAPAVKERDLVTVKTGAWAGAKGPVTFANPWPTHTEVHVQTFVPQPANG